jgi:cystathionine gamma-synthase
MAGSLIANPHTEIGRAIQADLEARHGEERALFEADAWAVYQNSHSFPERNARINETAGQLADFLKHHGDVDRVHYPKYNAPHHYYPSSSSSSSSSSQQQQGIDNNNNNFGGLFSIVLANHICHRTFYDALDVAKGPSLGTNFTLACPYTLLAHYHELDFAMSYNVQPTLLRISVGLEPLPELQEKFSSALRASRLHPKIVAAANHQKRAYTTTTICGRRSLQMAVKIVARRGRGIAL